MGWMERSETRQDARTKPGFATLHRIYGLSANEV